MDNLENVRVTDLTSGVVPPPMCHYSMEFPDTVSAIAQCGAGAAFFLTNHFFHICKFIINFINFRRNKLFFKVLCNVLKFLCFL